MQRLSEEFLPNVAIVAGESSEALGEVAPFTRDYHKINNRTTIYVCENFACQQPTTDAEQAITMIME